MISNNAKDRNWLNNLLFESKLFCLFLLLLFVQNFQAQITVTEGAIFYSEKEVVIHQEEANSSTSSAKIYVSSQAEISNAHLISGAIEIIAEIDFKKEKKSRKAAVLKEHQETKIAKTEITVTPKANIDAPKFNSLESSTSIAFNKSFSEKIVSGSSFYFKHFINKEFFTNANRFVFNDLTSINLYIADFFCNIQSLTFSVRPPPFQV